MLFSVLPALAQSDAITDPAQQDFLARVLIFVGQAMIDHAHDWAGYALLSFPLLTKLVGWLMPREWLFSALKMAASPAIAIFKMVKGEKK
jgi:hypothetical protein